MTIIAAVAPIEPYEPGGQIIDRDWSEVLDHPGDEKEHRALALWVERSDPDVIDDNLEDRRPPWSMVVRVPASKAPGDQPMYFLARGYISTDDIFIPRIVVTQDLGDDNQAWLRIAAGRTKPDSAL